MSILLFALLVILVLALALYAVRLIPGIDPPISLIIQLVLVILAIVVIVQRAGLL